MRTYTIKIVGGVLLDRELEKDLKRAEGYTVDVTISKHEPYKKRSPSQNAYWFQMLEKYVVPAFREYGDAWTAYKVHEYIMNELGYQDVITGPKGRLFLTRMESSKFKTTEWEEYMERARALLATEHEIIIPLPNEELIDGKE